MTFQYTDAQQARRTLNEIMLRRIGKLTLPIPDDSSAEPGLLAALLKNTERLGCTFSPGLLKAASVLGRKQLVELHKTTIATLRKMRGDHVPYKPMYPNFPDQVMAMDEAELYLNALLHYLTGILPESEKQERPAIKIRPNLRPIDLGSEEEFVQMIRNLAASNGALSEEDKQDLKTALNIADEPLFLLPDEIPYKENAAFAAAVLLERGMADPARLAPHFRTATDVLRLAAGLSGLDTSLAWARKIKRQTQPFANPYNLLQGMRLADDHSAVLAAESARGGSYRFRKFKRAERRLLLGLLEKSGASLEDMLLYRELWKRLGEILHPGELRSRYPKAFDSFTRLRREKSIPNFRRDVEEGLKARDPRVIEKLSERPGELARRMDLLLRSQPESAEAAFEAFGRVSGRMAVPLLLQLLAHFKHRNERRTYRVFFPKGNIGKVVAVYNELPPLEAELCERLVRMIEAELVSRFADRKPLGRVYIDHRLSGIPVPFTQRSASRALRPLPRSSRVSIPEGEVLRLFCWWTNIRTGDPETRRVDVDLSLVLLDANWKHVDTLSFYNLKKAYGVHSGDITDAPKGASEFIDLNLSAVLKNRKIRYAMVQVACFTGQPFSQLPECFAGFMMRTDGRSGAIYDPRTVETKFDLTIEAQQAVPFAVDLRERELIWMDAALKNRSFRITAHDNMSGLQLLGHAFADLRKTTLSELYTLHAKARGTIVGSPDEADTVFGLEEGLTPYRTDVILAEYV
ncbi:TerD family protein [Saccharibacillus alkalitolerans]|uniref:TerD family protein n=1 Tax=Saccharibacillus alkalitolerans TaxID=2705290 RepID=A0ABX0F0S0_9BACL|nr:TerD family protein [Saccharibacillus alkalitolerans]NGZ74571.1 TerD family protein [Saccharibacillus alkalitolerans]